MTTMKIEYIAVRAIALSALIASAVLACLSENWHSLSAHVLAAWFAFVTIHTERKLAAARGTILQRDKRVQKFVMGIHAYIGSIKMQTPNALTEWSRGYSYGRLTILTEALKILKPKTDGDKR